MALAAMFVLQIACGGVAYFKMGEFYNFYGSVGVPESGMVDFARSVKVRLGRALYTVPPAVTGVLALWYIGKRNWPCSNPSELLFIIAVWVFLHAVFILFLFLCLAPTGFSRT